MRKVIFFVALFLSPLSLLSQNLSLYTGSSMGFTSDETWPRFAFCIGGSAQANISKSFLFEQHLIYSQKGSSLDRNDLVRFNTSEGAFDCHSIAFQVNSLDLVSFIGLKVSKNFIASVGTGLSFNLIVRNKYSLGSRHFFDTRKSNELDTPIYFKARIPFYVDGKTFFIESIYIHGMQEIFTGSNLKTRTLSLSMGIII